MKFLVRHMKYIILLDTIKFYFLMHGDYSDLNPK